MRKRFPAFTSQSSIRRRREIMSKESDFLIYCMERYRYFKGLSGADVAKTFDEYGIYRYITRYFESLHTMGDHCIVQDIDDYISSITGNKRIKA